MKRITKQRGPQAAYALKTEMRKQYKQMQALTALRDVMVEHEIYFQCNWYPLHMYLGSIKYPENYVCEIDEMTINELNRLIEPEQGE